MSVALLDELRALIQRDVNNRGLARDPHNNLFTACRDDFANACRSIAETPQPVISIVTGFFISEAQHPCAETDGPLGALFLARAGQALGIQTVLLTDDFCRPALEVGVQESDLGAMVPVFELDQMTDGSPVAVASDSGGKYPVFILPEELRSTHLIAIERVGPGREGRYYNMHAADLTWHMERADLLFQGSGRKFTTIGIGDGGNEIGMGKIRPDVIARNIPYGELIACRVPTDHLIVAGVSNWGAYALAAGVAVLRRQRLPASLFDVERERELLRIMVEQGPLVDGVTAQQTVTVDGLAFDDYVEPLRQIGKLLEKEQWLT